MSTIRQVMQRLRSSNQKGSILEEALKDLLVDLGFNAVHKQQSGSQYGFDLLAFSPTSEGTPEIWKFECKNLSSPLSPNDVAPKLIWHLAPNTVDHFVIVSVTDPSNDLRHLLEDHHFSFPISIWSGEELARLLANSPRVCARLNLTSPKSKEPSSRMAVLPPPLLPSRRVFFDVFHGQDPPRQFAYLKLNDSVIKSYTADDCKLIAFVTNAEEENIQVVGLTCTTLSWNQTESRVVLQNKAKGLYEPSKLDVHPSTTPGGVVDILLGRAISVDKGRTELVRLEIIGDNPGL